MSNSSRSPAPPDVVRRWLVAKYLEDPVPAIDSRLNESVVHVPLRELNAHLLASGIEPLECLDACTSLGWIVDHMIWHRLVTNAGAENAKPDAELAARAIQRLNLPLGEHRLVGIRRAVLDAPKGSAVPDADAGANREQIGAFAPGCFRWKPGPDGLITQIPLKQWKLLKELLVAGSQGADVFKLAKAIGCKRDAEDKRRAIKNLSGRLTDTLIKRGAPFRAKLTTAGADTAILIDTRKEQNHAA